MLHNTVLFIVNTKTCDRINEPSRPCDKKQFHVPFLHYGSFGARSKKYEMLVVSIVPSQHIVWDKRTLIKNVRENVRENTVYEATTLDMNHVWLKQIILRWHIVQRRFYRSNETGLSGDNRKLFVSGFLRSNFIDSYKHFPPS